MSTHILFIAYQNNSSINGSCLFIVTRCVLWEGDLGTSPPGNWGEDPPSGTFRESLPSLEYWEESSTLDSWSIPRLLECPYSHLGIKIEKISSQISSLYPVSSPPPPELEILFNPGGGELQICAVFCAPLPEIPTRKLHNKPLVVTLLTVK